MKILFLLFFVSLPIFAEDMAFDKETGHIVPKYVGELKSFRGRLYKKNSQGRMLEVKPGTRFYKDETLVTEEKSLAKLLIVDDTQLTVGPDSEINFEEFKFVSKSNRKIIYSLFKGQLRGDVRHKSGAGEPDVIVKTKNATLGVRGTKILVNHRTLKNLEVSEFALESGSAEVTDTLRKLKHDIIKDERVVVVSDLGTNESANEKNKLHPSELDLLKDDEEFLPFYDLPNVQEGSPLFTLLNRAAASAPTEAETEVSVDKSGTEGKGSFYNLDKLNEKLREGQKRR